MMPKVSTWEWIYAYCRVLGYDRMQSCASADMHTDEVQSDPDDRELAQRIREFAQALEDAK